MPPDTVAMLLKGYGSAEAIKPLFNAVLEQAGKDEDLSTEYLNELQKKISLVTEERAGRKAISRLSTNYGGSGLR